MSGFILYRAPKGASHTASAGGDSTNNSVRYGDYVLRHYGSGYRQLGETGIYIGGYVLPRNSLFAAYGNTGQHELVAGLYAKNGRSFTDHIKGRFVVIIMAGGRVEVYFDHLGLYRAFYNTTGERYMIAGTVKQLAEVGATLKPDRVSLAMQALFHRVPGKYTVYSDIYKTTGADSFTLEAGKVSHARYFSPQNLLLPGEHNEKTAVDEFGRVTYGKAPGREDAIGEPSRPASGKGVTIDDFSRLFLDNVTNLNGYLTPGTTFITLTGGKDSRTILAALLAAGIKPEGLTYGNSSSRDAVYAGMLAREAGIRHLIAAPPATAEWHGAAARDIIVTGDPEISIHRALRHFAFVSAARSAGSAGSVPPVRFDGSAGSAGSVAQVMAAGSAGSAGRNCAFYTGYLGGELLMGIYHDDLIFSGFLKNLWDGGSFNMLAEQRLNDYFIKADSQLVREARERMTEMACTDMSLTPKQREFNAIFEIGIPHHTQDITLASLFWDYPCPLYLDIEFLELIFRSRYSFLFRDASTVNPFRRHELFSLNMGIQHRLFPALDRVPFGKRGSYSTREYLRGPILWSLVKGYRYLAERGKYPPSYTYGSEYGEFLAGVLNEAEIAGSPLDGFYDLPRAVAGLKKLEFPLQEKHLHKYSAIAALHMMYSDIG